MCVYWSILPLAFRYIYIVNMKASKLLMNVSFSGTESESGASVTASDADMSDLETEISLYLKTCITYKTSIK